MDQIPKEVKFLTFQFVRHFWREIAKIGANKFCPIKFSKFCHIKRCNDRYKDQILIEKYTLKIKKIINRYQNYD